MLNYQLGGQVAVLEELTVLPRSLCRIFRGREGRKGRATQ